MRKLIPALALFTVTALVERAHAQAAEVGAAEVVTSPTGAPTIEVTLLGGPRLPAHALRLREASAGASTGTRATTVRSYADGNEPLALAIVYNGQEVWLGNETFEADDGARFIGALPGVRAAIDEIAAQRYPAGSQVALVAYATGAAIRLPLSPIASLHGSVLGTQLDYRNQIGTDLVTGIEQGIRQLEMSRTPIKALIVIGDGNDTNNEAAKPALAELKKHAAREGIQTFGIIYKGVLSDEGQVLTAMISRTQTVASFEGITSAIDSILGRLTDRAYATFPGDALAWDGREHALTVSTGGEDLEPTFVALPYIAQPTPWYRTGWFLQLLAGFGAVALLAVGMRATFRWRDPV